MEVPNVHIYCKRRSIEPNCSVGSLVGGVVLVPVNVFVGKRDLKERDCTYNLHLQIHIPSEIMPRKWCQWAMYELQAFDQTFIIAEEGVAAVHLGDVVEAAEMVNKAEKGQASIAFGAE
jgi:hypothetical protein